jgi:hypothetical protein
MEAEKQKKKRNLYGQAKNGIKRCSTCSDYKPVAEFCKNGRTKDGYQNVCRACKHEYWNRWHQKNYTDPVYRRRLNDTQMKVGLNRNLRKYGLTMDEYKILVARGCGVCGGSPNGRGRYHFDHDHETDKFRGLLCSHCNTALGLFKDSKDALFKAIVYLSKQENQLQN